MRESILTIPVNEVFEPKIGCPVCRMRNTVEEHICEYIMGAAMMEPDVREETNKLGFCGTHFKQLLMQNNRLSLGLMLDSHLGEVRRRIFENNNPLIPKSVKHKRSQVLTETCFVCSKVDWGINHMTKTVFTMFEKDSKFREMFKEQEYICLPHYGFLAERAAELPKNETANFMKALDELVGKYVKQLNSDLREFCDSFDYRNAGKLHSQGMEHVKNSVSRGINFLTGREIEKD